jgi:RNA-directed DNA polymerase
LGSRLPKAVAQAQQYIAQDYGWVIDFDLDKFLDPLNQDKLMGQIARCVENKRLLKNAKINFPLS